MTNETDLAWLAGIWDGEGSIFMQVQIKRQLTPTISMDNTDPAIVAKTVEILKSLGLNIHINEYKNKKGSTRPVWRVATSRLDYIKIFTDALIPYLQGEKKSKAKLVNQFVTSRLSRGKVNYSNDEKQICDQLRSSTTTRETPFTVMI